MGTYLRDTYLRPARDEAERHQLGMIVANFRRMRADIERIFLDVDHWNCTHPDEEPIDPDPDGTLRQMADEIDTLLLAEQTTEM